MKYLNLGCGYQYSSEKEWTNLDFISTGEGVIAHNLLRGIPFNDNSFDLVYHSHVLEHFTKEDGEKMIAECFRVLKPGGVLRIAVPDLERIARTYLHFLDLGLKDPDDELIKANYDWMLLEMYDQTVRNISGGNMAKYFFREMIINEDFVFERIGQEGKNLRNAYLSSFNSPVINTTRKFSKITPGRIMNKIKRTIKKSLSLKLKADTPEVKIGKFRLGGEIHQWMYDTYSLSNLLVLKGGNNVKVRDAFTSFIDNWSVYNLDGKEGITRKPDSLFIEAKKE